MATTVTIGRSGADHVRLDVLRRERPDDTDFWDGNWLVTRIVLKAGGFTGQFVASLRAEEFTRFWDAVAALRETLEGEAVFETMEEQLRVRVAKEGSFGGLKVTGRARDVAGTGNMLEFALGEFDQTDLGPLIADLETLTEAFPVRGQVTGD